MRNHMILQPEDMQGTLTPQDWAHKLSCSVIWPMTFQGKITMIWWDPKQDQLRNSYKIWQLSCKRCVIHVIHHSLNRLYAACNPVERTSEQSYIQSTVGEQHNKGVDRKVMDAKCINSRTKGQEVLLGSGVNISKLRYGTHPLLGYRISLKRVFISFERLNSERPNRS